MDGRKNERLEKSINEFGTDIRVEMQTIKEHCRDRYKALTGVIEKDNDIIREEINKKVTKGEIDVAVNKGMEILAKKPTEYK